MKAFTSINLLLLLATATTVFSQEAKCQHYAVEALKMNIAYIGVPSPISVVAEGYTCKSIVVTTDNGKLEKSEGCEYIFYPYQVGKATISIFSKSENKPIGARHFRVKHLPAPAARISGQNGGTIQASTLRVQLGILTQLDGFDFDIKYNITQYYLTLINANGTCATFGPANTAFFTEQMKIALQNVKSGDRIIVSSIKVVSPFSKDELFVYPLDLTVD